jgi:hypothetical protein
LISNLFKLRYTKTLVKYTLVVSLSAFHAQLDHETSTHHWFNLFMESKLVHTIARLWNSGRESLAGEASLGRHAFQGYILVLASFCYSVLILVTMW